MPSPSREAALDQLDRIEFRGAFVGHFTSEENRRLDPRDRRQTTEYVAGVTRWKRRLDFILSHFYRGEFADMEAQLRLILRLGLYDLLYMQTPPHAALNEAVTLAKKRVREGAGGLTNGILRSVQRAQGDLPVPDSGDLADDLAVEHSHPTWMVRRWLARFGREETEALLRWNNTRPVYHVRVNTLKQTPEEFLASLRKLDTQDDDVQDEHTHLEGRGDVAAPGEEAADVGTPESDEPESASGEAASSIGAMPSPYLDDFVRVDRLQPLLQAGWLREGRCMVQDDSAGLVVRILDPQPGERLLDGCAAPGGKALYAAARMQNAGHVAADDIIEGKLERLREAASRLGVTIIATEPGDLREKPVGELFDAVLVDAPCSGFGVMAKRADLRWRRSPEDLDELAALQDELLEAAAKHVKPGGRLVYSTCTIAPEENEARVDVFLARRADFDIESAAPYVPAEMLTDEGYYATFPQRHAIDGAFAVRLRRKT